MPCCDNLTLLKAIYLAQSGDILVVDFGNNSEVSPWGAIAATASLEKSIAGLVINSSVRDIDELKKISFPVFALSSCMKGTTKNYFGFINHLITCGGVTVVPGDIIVDVDSETVVVIKKI
jgi:regulator of RNase E activity RraA